MVDDSSVTWEVAWQWDTEVKYVIATDVPSTELSQLIASSLVAGKSWKHGSPIRVPALSVTRMDVTTYKSDRAAARKGKRKHPVEREWQRVMKEASAEAKRAKLEDGRRIKVRRVGSTVDSNISAYIERHFDGQAVDGERDARAGV